MARKIILCRCEDVTQHDLARAVKAGFDDLEEVKRFTGFGTGPCQGKECLRNVVEALADLTQRSAADLVPFTARPPLSPTRLRVLAVDATPSSRPASSSPVVEVASFTAPPSWTASHPGRSRPPTTARSGTAAVDVLIVGAGIMGLALASYLTRESRLKVHVLEAGHLASGASGRNGGGLRQQWSSELNIRLMQESMAICDSFASEMGVNVWMRRGGYLFLASEEGVRSRLENAVALQNECGVPTRLLSPEGARQLVPELEPDGFAMAAYNPTDAVVFPWPFLWGYAQDAQARGATIATFTELTALEPRPQGGFRAETSRGPLEAERVVCCAGAWSPRVAALLGVTLPTWPVRHEILSTEPLKPFLRPLVSVLDTGLYVSQSMRGELVGGLGLPEAPDGQVHLGSRLVFLTEMARHLVALMPRLAEVKVVRQWAGPYDLSPDGEPLLGELPSVPGFFVTCGFHGHGFMMAPVVARYLGQHLLGRGTHPIFSSWRPERFATGSSPHDQTVREEMVIG